MKTFTGTDFCVYSSLVMLGTLQFGLSARSLDFFAGDVTYFELARSIIENGFYGYNFKPESTLPPGFPMILASLCTTVGCSYTFLVRSITIFAALGFVASYELLCCLEGQAAAAVVCLLLATSPIIFATATRAVMPDLPYFLTSVLTLMLAVQLDDGRNSRARVVLRTLLGFLLVGSLLIRSAGIALLTGLAAWLTVSCFTNREAAARRLRTFIPLLVFATVVQAGWGLWSARHEALQWPMIGGYPQSYIKQLGVKNGNYPELGTASLSDIPARVTQNLNEHAVTLVKLLTRKEYVNPSWVSPLVLGSVLLTALGVTCSIWPSGGGLAEWYFISYEMMYLLWPWYGDIRFFLPITPLACLYLWRGAKAVVHLCSRLPRVVGGLTFPLSAFLAMGAAAGWRSGDLQPKLSAIFWMLVSIGSAWIVLVRTDKPAVLLASFAARLGSFVSAKTKGLAVLRTVGVVIVAALIIVGIAQQLAVGRGNLSFDITKQSAYADVAAGKWIAANTASSAIVMARQLSVVYHYSKRKVIWFPPSSDAQILMEGIRKHKVQYVIVSERFLNYWLPPEGVCFDSLSRVYPKAFSLMHEEPRFRVFRVVPEYSNAGSAAGTPS